MVVASVVDRVRATSSLTASLPTRSGTSARTASLIRWAALPVGAARATSSLRPRPAASRWATARRRATVWVLPVPGPPAMIDTPEVIARRTAVRCRSGPSAPAGSNRSSRADSRASASPSPPSGTPARAR